MKKLLLFIIVLISGAAFSQQSIDVKKATVRNWIIYQGDTLNVISSNGDTIFTVKGSTKDTLITGAAHWAKTGTVITPKITTDTVKITGNFRLPLTTAGTGIIYKSASPWLHDFKGTGTSGENIFLGKAGNLTLTGSDAGDEGSANIGIGYWTLLSLTTGKFNTSIGYRSNEGTRTGSYNTSLGYNALQDYGLAGTAKTGNVAIGFQALRFNTADYNTAIGMSSLAANTGGINNTAVGAYTLQYAVEGDVTYKNYGFTAMGTSALATTTYGYAVTAIGANAMGDADSTITCVAIGNNSLQHSKRACNDAVGNSTLMEVIYGVDNIAMGTGALMNLRSTMSWNNAFTGSENIGIGTYVGDSINYSGEVKGSGCGNVLMGQYVMRRGRTISQNTAIGYYAGYNNIIGDSNVYIGNIAGFNATGSHNVFLGNGAGYNETGSNKLYIANDSTSLGGFTTRDGVLIFGDFDNNYVNIYNKLAIGIAKSPSYNLEVEGDSYFNGDITVKGDTSKFHTNVVVDSSFVMKYNGWFFGYGDYNDNGYNGLGMFTPNGNGFYTDDSTGGTTQISMGSASIGLSQTGIVLSSVGGKSLSLSDNNDVISLASDSTYVGGEMVINGDLTVTGQIKYDYKHLVIYTSGGSYAPNVTSNVEFRLLPTFQTTENDGLTFAGDSITVITPGDYVVNFSTVFQGTNGDDWVFKCRKNGVAITTGNLALSTTGAGNYCSGSWIWYIKALAAGDDVCFTVTNEGSNNDPTFRSIKVFMEMKPE